MHSLQGKKKTGPQGWAQTLNKEKIRSASLEAVQDLLGRYFGFSLDFKFSTADGSPYLQGLGSVHVPLSPLVFFKQSVSRHFFDFYDAVALLALTPSPCNDSYPGRNSVSFKGTVVLSSAYSVGEFYSLLRFLGW